MTTIWRSSLLLLAAQSEYKTTGPTEVLVVLENTDPALSSTLIPTLDTSGDRRGPLPQLAIRVTDPLGRELSANLHPLRAGVFLKAADQHLREVHLVDLEALALDGLDAHKLRRLEMVAGRRILEQRRQAGERMEVHRQR